jgi:hypothetical protein
VIKKKTTKKLKYIAPEQSLADNIYYNTIVDRVRQTSKKCKKKENLYGTARLYVMMFA